MVEGRPAWQPCILNINGRMKRLVMRTGMKRGQYDDIDVSRGNARFSTAERALRIGFALSGRAGYFGHTQLTSSTACRSVRNV